MSRSKATYLDADSSLMEKNLRFIKDEAEEEFNNMFGPIMEQAEDISSGRSKIVKPLPGFCIKTFIKDTREKFFINVCHTNGIPAPEDITDDQLLALLNDGTPGSFKIPMSIAVPRLIKDSSAKQCQVCDIAVNSTFFKKIESGCLMRDFLITIVFEGLSSKYNITLDEMDFRVLKNKKFVDKLIAHNIQNRDVKAVYESYQNPPAPDLRSFEESLGHTKKPTKKLIEEIDPSTIKNIKDEKNKKSGKDEYVPDPTKVAISQAASKKPDCRLFKEPAVGKPRVLIGEFYLPECTSSKEITLDIGEDRILLEARKKGYLLDVFVDYSIDESRTKASFNTETKMLNVIMPVLAL
ncbi:PIH1 domain-containing protein 1 [Topomyia yanbarensis]|uniref:PIH1 domain-containing protein 1 n=1 Tax=Topomyia yanbarensis TaxID=2498891 RepID=UPI00273C00FD|nr:PIH1 domain-containing protein 1 [Topomyia yanbarensis]